MQNSSLPRITEVADLEGRRVLVRASLNLPVKDGVVTNQFRLMRGLATVQYLVGQGAKVVMMGHIGRDPEASLKPVYEALKEHIPIQFCEHVGGPDALSCVEDMQNGDVVLLENLRRDPREKNNDADFARSLADLGDIYVNDAFPVAHRSHASVVGVPAFLPSYAGLNFVNEYEELSGALKPEHPALFLIGGAKFETKMPLVEKCLSIYDYIFVAGALANDFFRAKGYEIGKSLVSDASLNLDALIADERVLLPVDVTVVSEANGVRVTSPEDVHPNEMIVDVGPDSVAMLASYIEKATMVVWNGPFGNYENGFDTQTKACAACIAKSDAYSIVGGGDTVAAIAELGLQDQFNFVSTAGGAMLTFLEEGTLPGIDALQSSV